MSKEIYISCTPHETRLAIVENDELAEIYYERENEYTLAGSIYNGRVTRVLPGMQSAFVDIGLERDAFLYITDFMEEAGDSAEFEGGGERAPREARSDRGGERNERGEGRKDRGSRGDRNDRADQPRKSAEPTDEELFANAVSGLDPARPVTETIRSEGNRSEQGRGERSGRRRGGRDRRSNSDGTPRRESAEAGAREKQTETQAEEPIDIIVTPETGSTEAVGEGAPGADGSRRWRGRRGRRGTRLTGQTGQEEKTTGTESAGEIVDEAPEIFTDDDGVFAPLETAAVAEPEVTERPAGRDREGRDRGGREGRGRDGRGRGGDRGRGGQTSPPRVPRGFAPSQNLYQVEGAADDSSEEMEPAPRPYGVEEHIPAPAEPMILPGESLGKYRKGADGRVEQVPAAAAPAPAPPAEFKLNGAWDGGSVLPGETLRPRAQSGAGATEERSERGREDRGGRDGRGRDGRGRGGDRGRGGRESRGEERFGLSAGNDRAGETQHAAEPVFIHAVQPPVEASPEQHSEFGHAIELPAKLAEVHSEPAAEFPVAEELPVERAEASHAVAPIHSTFVAPPPMPGEQAMQEKSVEPEYEPEEASASFRVDPIPPSEYRQAAPAIEAHEPNAEPTQDSVHDSVQAAVQDAEAPQPEVTTLSDTGDMHSEPVLSNEAAALSTEEPRADETVVHGIHLSDREEAFAGFAPGDGLLEEEEMVDEDAPEAGLLAGVYAARTAQYDEREADGHEQEALEVVADLGTMLREREIDDITHTEPAQAEDEDDLEDDEDFEEDFLEEDGSAEAEQTASSETAHDHADHSRESSVSEIEETAGEGEPGQADERVAAAREPRRRDERGRRDGRRGGGERNRRGSGERSPDRSNSERSSSDRTSNLDRSSSSDRGGSERSRDSRGGRGSRQSMQMTNLPAISDLLKPGQEILCQIAKEPIAKKGARITSHIALPGRFLVFMPTVHHTGVSRKIESDGERRRLKEILLSEKGEAAGGFIVRTAAAGASEEELRSDLRFLLNLWSDIKTRSESSKSPALIYHDLNLIERVLRDQVTDNFSAIWVDTEAEYERVLRFLQRFQPSLIRRVKLYTKETPLFEQFGITEEINKALRSKVWLKSGGSIVINQTEALVAIDINTGKYVGKTARLEDTIVKTNLDAIPEIVRQIRLRDLGGIIIIDFIDMDERKNRNKVMAALEEELKSDRAPSKVLQFNDFGLVAITRKRVKQSLERTLSTTCGVCAGTGMTKSPITVCNDIYVEMRKMQKHLDRGDVMLRVHPEVVKQLKAPSTHWLQELEEMVGKTILVKSDPSLHPEQFDIH